MNWKVGDIAQGKMSGYIYEVVQVDEIFGKAKIIKGHHSIGAIVPVSLNNLIAVKPRKGKPHPLTNIFK